MKSDRLKRLEGEMEKLRARIQKARSREADEERRRATRAKIIAGAAVAAALRSGEIDRSTWVALVDKFVEERDRPLAWGLLPQSPADGASQIAE